MLQAQLSWQWGVRHRKCLPVSLVYASFWYGVDMIVTIDNKYYCRNVHYRVRRWYRSNRGVCCVQHTPACLLLLSFCNAGEISVLVSSWLWMLTYSLIKLNRNLLRGHVMSLQSPTKRTKCFSWSSPWNAYMFALQGIRSCKTHLQHPLICIVHTAIHIVTSM